MKEKKRATKKKMSEKIGMYKEDVKMHTRNTMTLHTCLRHLLHGFLCLEKTSVGSVVGVEVRVSERVEDMNAPDHRLHTRREHRHLDGVRGDRGRRVKENNKKNARDT